MAEGGHGWFTRVKTKDLKEEIFYLPNISEIDFTIGAQLTELPTIIYGAENNFVMDLGTYKQYEIQVERASPSDCDDMGDDQTKWSNGKWYQELEKFWDFWQNLTYDKEDGEIRGGLGFHYESAQPDLYPSISTNVFLTGAMSPTFGVQQMRVSMTLLVARADSESSSIVYGLVKYHITDDVMYEVKYPVGAQMSLAAIPSSYQAAIPKNGSVFKGWADASGTLYKLSDGTIFTIPDPETGILEFWAKWTQPYCVRVFIEPGDYEVEIPSGDDKPDRIITYILGGGGSGGKNGLAGTSEDLIGSTAGGGGGAGQFVTHEFRGFDSGEKLKITVGKGGFIFENGGRSSVSLNSHPVYAEGGYKGDNAPNQWDSVTKGGQQYITGGSAHNSNPGKSDNGGYTEGLGAPGIGAQTYVSSIPRAGGGGGAGADLNHTLIKITENITDNSEIVVDQDLGWWNAAGIFEQKVNCDAHYKGITGSLGHYNMYCTPKNEGFYMYRVVFGDGKNPSYSEYKIKTIWGIYSESLTGSATFRSQGGDGSGEGLGTMGLLGGGGGGTTFTNAVEFAHSPSIPGGSGFVALLYIKDDE